MTYTIVTIIIMIIIIVAAIRFFTSRGNPLAYRKQEPYELEYEYTLQSVGIPVQLYNVNATEAQKMLATGKYILIGEPSPAHMYNNKRIPVGTRLARK